MWVDTKGTLRKSELAAYKRHSSSPMGQEAHESVDSTCCYYCVTFDLETNMTFERQKKVRCLLGVISKSRVCKKSSGDTIQQTWSNYMSKGLLFGGSRWITTYVPTWNPAFRHPPPCSEIPPSKNEYFHRRPNVCPSRGRRWNPLDPWSDSQHALRLAPR